MEVEVERGAGEWTEYWAATGDVAVTGDLAMAMGESMAETEGEATLLRLERELLVP